MIYCVANATKQATTISFISTGEVLGDPAPVYILTMNKYATNVEEKVLLYCTTL